MTRHDGALTRLPNIQSQDCHPESNITAPFSNRLAEQNKSTMNLTFTVGSGHRKEQDPTRKARSSSADSDIVDFSVNGAITGVFPRRRCANIDISKTPLFSCNRGSASSTGALNRRWSNKLPSLNSCDSERKCCQRPWSRTQIELQKYKEALRNG